MGEPALRPPPPPPSKIQRLAERVEAAARDVEQRSSALQQQLTRGPVAWRMKGESELRVMRQNLIRSALPTLRRTSRQYDDFQLTRAVMHLGRAAHAADEALRAVAEDRRLRPDFNV